ncbi:MAG: hypothetical protein NUV37_01075 [Nanoarchaeota archaeon]|nr:hypothetical protein [Nanoarchaeota archaeon]
MKKEVNKFLYWTPRILSIIFICFLALFSFDVFGMGLSFWQTILALFLHNIPSFLLFVILLISWKYEWVGGIAFIIVGLLYIFLLLINPQLEWYMFSWSLIISGPAFLIGILFFIGWFKKKK